MRPPLLFKEDWKQPEKRLLTQEALTNPQLEVNLYGPEAKNIGVYQHEGRNDLWNGMATSPTAVTLKDKGNYFDLTGGLARLRWMVRTDGLHTLYPVVKLADGTMLAASEGVSTRGFFVQNEVAFDNQRWFKLDPQKVITLIEVPAPDLSKVDEIGWVDLAPGAGPGVGGWYNVSTVELYAKAVTR